jgi:hypothetical protein
LTVTNCISTDVALNVNGQVIDGTNTITVVEEAPASKKAKAKSKAPVSGTGKPTKSFLSAAPEPEEIPLVSKDMSKFVRSGDAGIDASVDGDSNKVVGRTLVGRPKKTQWVRVRPEPEYTGTVYILEPTEDREDIYIVSEDVVAQLGEEANLKRKRIVVAITTQGVPFLWTIRLAREDAKRDTWAESELKCLKEAKLGWRRIAAHMPTGSYECFKPATALRDPQWPTRTLDEMIASAFEGRMIENLDHQAIKLLGTR